MIIVLPKKYYYAQAKDPTKTMTELMSKAGKIMNFKQAMAAK